MVDQDPLKQVMTTFVQLARIVAHCTRMRYRVPEFGREDATAPFIDADSEKLLVRVNKAVGGHFRKQFHPEGEERPMLIAAVDFIANAMAPGTMRRTFKEWQMDPQDAASPGFYGDAVVHQVAEDFAPGFEGPLWTPEARRVHKVTRSYKAAAAARIAEHFGIGYRQMLTIVNQGRKQDRYPYGRAYPWDTEPYDILLRALADASGMDRDDFDPVYQAFFRALYGPALFGGTPPATTHSKD